MKKDVAYNYIKTYKLFQDKSIAKFYVKISDLFDKQIKHEKSLVQKADYMDELKKSREELDEEIKQIEQDLKKNIEQEAERLETTEEYSYDWSESKAKIEIANTYIEEVHKGYEKYLKKRPCCPSTQGNACLA